MSSYFINRPKEPEKPNITYCMSKEIRRKPCTNMNSRLFEIRSIKDKAGFVTSWEIECPICGTVWYKNVIREKVYPRKHRKITKQTI